MVRDRERGVSGVGKGVWVRRVLWVKRLEWMLVDGWIGVKERGYWRDGEGGSKGRMGGRWDC